MLTDIEKLKAIVKEAGEIIRHAALDKNSVTSKEGHRNFVTTYDKKVQDFLEKRLLETWPGFGFVAEEQDTPETVGERPCFIVDPIDGTANFIHGLNLSAISVGVAEGGRTRQGVVYNPFLEELFWAEEGKGAWFNGKRLTCPDETLGLSLFCVGMSPYYDELLPATLELMGKIQPLVTDLRRLGAASIDLCYIACGRQGGFCEWRLQPWDYAAGMLIATEAGAIVTDMDGSPLRLDGSSTILAAGPKAYAEFREKIDIKAIKPF